MFVNQERVMLSRMGGLVRYVVFFVVKLKTRAVEVAGITSQPHEAWMTQLARNLTDACDGFLRSAQYVILLTAPVPDATGETTQRHATLT